MDREAILKKYFQLLECWATETEKDPPIGISEMGEYLLAAQIPVEVFNEIHSEAIRLLGEAHPQLTLAQVMDRISDPLSKLIAMYRRALQTQVEKALKQTENLLQGVFRAAPAGIGVVDQDRNLTFINDQICKMLGYSQEELIGKNARILYPSDKDYEYVGEEKYKQIRESGSGSVQTRWMRKDGVIVDVLLSSSPIDLNDPSVGTTFTAFDITNRVQAENALRAAEQSLRESETRYRTIFETASVSIWEEDFSAVKDAIDDLIAEGVEDIRLYIDGHPEIINQMASLIKVRDINSATLKLFEAKSKPELLGSLDKVVVPETSGILREEIIAIAEGRTSLEGVTVNRTLEGKHLDILLSMTIPSHEDGFESVLVSMMDITDRVAVVSELQHKVEVLTVLHAVAMATAGATDEDTLIERTTAIIGERLYPDNLGVLLLDEETGTVFMHPSYRGQGSEGKKDPIPLGEGVTGTVAKIGIPLRIGNVEKEPIYLEYDPGMRSELCVPMKTGERVIGVINAESARLNEFTEADEQLLMTIGGQLATAIERARLFEASQRQTRELAGLHEVDLAISTSLDTQRVYATIVGRAVELINCDIAHLWILEEVSQEFVGVISYGVNDRGVEGERYTVEASGIVVDLLDTQQVVAIKDAKEDPRLVPYWLERFKTRALLAVPLVYRDNVTGFITLLDMGRPRQWRAEEIELAGSLAAQAAIAVENSRLYERTRRNALEFKGLYETTRDLAGEQDLQALLQAVVERAADLLKTSYSGIYLYDSEHNNLILALSNDENFPSVTYLEMGEGVAGRVAEARQPMIIDDYREWKNRSPQYDGIPYTSVLEVPMLYAGELIGVLAVYEAFPKQRSFSEDDVHLLSLLAAQAAGAVHSARLFEQTKQRLTELEALSNISVALRSAHTVEEMLPILLTETAQVVDAGTGVIFLLEAESGDLVAQCWHPPNSDLVGIRHASGEGITGYVATTGEVYITKNILLDPKAKILPEEHHRIANMRTNISIPLRAELQTVGVMHIVRSEERPFTEDDVRLLSSIGNIAATAIQRAALHEQTRRNLARLATLHNIDQAISASLDLNITLDIFLDQLLNILRVSAAAILYFNPSLQILEYAAGRGFFTQPITRSSIRLGDGYTSRAVLERKIVHIEDLSAATHTFSRPEMIKSESFRGYCAAPLIVKGQVRGVLEIFHREPLKVDEEWLEFLQMLAAQAAIAIDSASMFNEVQRANVELTMAYDQTIEGWSRALELRDMETVGHSKRVTERTVELARALGVKEDDLVHMRRGAFLHDIGKMGIPDVILNKPEALTEEEWELMRQHPVYAYELLYPITFLRPALDIPHYHHEKWDGNGYPYGLKGSQIPLAARIFAVIDVWDALRSERPYRDAWPDEVVVSHIREQSGIYFDPEVVECFLALID